MRQRPRLELPPLLLRRITRPPIRLATLDVQRSLFQAHMDYVAPAGICCIVALHDYALLPWSASNLAAGK